MLSDSLLQLAKETPQQLQKDIEDAIKYLDSITIDADHIQEVQTINDNLTEEQDQMIVLNIFPSSTCRWSTTSSQKSSISCRSC